MAAARASHRSWRALAAPAGRILRADDPGRSRRVVVLLTLLWIISILDLICTLWASRLEGFVELNPLAAPLVHSMAALATFKIGTFTLASAVLLTFRRRVLTEVGCWLACAAYVAVAGVWQAYFLVIP